MTASGRLNTDYGGTVIRLYLLGRTICERADGQSIDTLLRASKRLALLSYLAVQEPTGFQRRDTLFGLFWPRLDASRASGALRQTLLRLRADIGSALVTRGRAEVGVDPSALWCDVTAFRREVAQGKLRGPLGLFRGDLLAGFYLPDTPEFERWLEAERRCLRRSASRAAWRLADRDQALPDAAELVQRAASLTPFDEVSARRLMAFLVARGDRAGAMLTYRRLRGLLADIGLSPGPETRMLAAAIRQPDATAIRAGRSFAAPPEARTTAESAAMARALRHRARELLETADRLDATDSPLELEGSSPSGSDLPLHST